MYIAKLTHGQHSKLIEKLHMYAVKLSTSLCIEIFLLPIGSFHVEGDKLKFIFVSTPNLMNYKQHEN